MIIRGDSVDVARLYSLYSHNLNSIINSKTLRDLADRSHDIHGLNLMNRILVYIQNKYATSVKSDKAWNIIGLKIDSKVSPIWIFDTVIKTVYTNPKTGKPVDNTGLAPSELQEAVRLGVIDKVQSLESMKILPVYNIKNTVCYNEALYNSYLKHVHKPTRLSKILSMVESEYTKNLEDEHSYYDIDRDAIIIGSDSSYNKLRAIADSIYYKLDLKSIVPRNINISRDVISILLDINRKFIQESILSYCDPNYSINHDTFSNIDKLNISKTELDIFIKLLSISYEAVEDLILRLKSNPYIIQESTVRKANELLTILEAHEVLVKFKEV